MYISLQASDHGSYLLMLSVLSVNVQELCFCCQPNALDLSETLITSTCFFLKLYCSIDSILMAYGFNVVYSLIISPSIICKNSGF